MMMITTQTTTRRQICRATAHKPSGRLTRRMALTMTSTAPDLSTTTAPVTTTIALPTPGPLSTILEDSKVAPPPEEEQKLWKEVFTTALSVAFTAAKGVADRHVHWRQLRTPAKCYLEDYAECIADTLGVDDEDDDESKYDPDPDCNPLCSYDNFSELKLLLDESGAMEYIDEYESEDSYNKIVRFFVKSFVAVAYPQLDLKDVAQTSSKSVSCDGSSYPIRDDEDEKQEQAGIFYRAAYLDAMTRGTKAETEQILDERILLPLRESLIELEGLSADSEPSEMSGVKVSFMTNGVFTAADCTPNDRGWSTVGRAVWADCTTPQYLQFVSRVQGVFAPLPPKEDGTKRFIYFDAWSFGGTEILKCPSDEEKEGDETGQEEFVPFVFEEGQVATFAFGGKQAHEHALKVRVQFGSVDEEEDTDTNTCAICLSEASEVRLTGCGHASMCGPCFNAIPEEELYDEDTGEERTTKRCPICRTDIKTNMANVSVAVHHFVG
jgi:hypothetical protein